MTIVQIVTLALAAWGAGLSTVLVTLKVIDLRRQRRVLVDLAPFIVHSPQPGGGTDVSLHLEATNRSEHNICLKRWLLEDPAGGALLAGSAYDGRKQGPDLLRPRQLHGWTLGPDKLRFVTPPARVTVELTTGERFSTGVLRW